MFHFPYSSCVFWWLPYVRTYSTTPNCTLIPAVGFQSHPGCIFDKLFCSRRSHSPSQAFFQFPSLTPCTCMHTERRRSKNIGKASKLVFSFPTFLSLFDEEALLSLSHLAFFEFFQGLLLKFCLRKGNEFPHTSSAFAESGLEIRVRFALLHSRFRGNSAPIWSSFSASGTPSEIDFLLLFS